MFSFSSELYAAPAVTIENLSDSPDPFSPDNDAIDDTALISADISISGFDSLIKPGKTVLLKWELVIKNSQGKAISKEVDTRQVGDNSVIKVLVTWDGRKAGKKPVPDGLYSYEFSAQAKKIEAQPRAGEITVKTLFPLSVSVSPDFWQVGELPPSSVVTMNEETKIIVTNDGQEKETCALQLINPQSWQCSQTAVGSDTYILNAAFSSNAGNITWTEANHALSTAVVPCSDTKFAGDQSGVNILPGETRSLWLQFKAPDSTTVEGEQEIKVIINAQTP